MLLGIHCHNFGVLHDTSFGMSFSDLAGLTASQAAILDDPAASPLREDRLPLGPLCALIGRNSTGKSALFAALSFISVRLRHDVAFACEQCGRSGFTSMKTRGDCSDICFSLLFSGEADGEFLSYELCLSSDRHGRPFVARESVCQARFGTDGLTVETLLDLEQGRGKIREAGVLHETALSETKAPALAAYGLLLSCPELNRIHDQVSRWFFDRLSQPADPSRRPEPVRQGGHRHVSVTGDNVRNVLEFLQIEHPEQYGQAMNRISERMPTEKRIDQAFSNGVSSGTRKLFTILLLLEDPDPRPLICLEEPDGGLYHENVDSLAFALRDFTIRNPACQILFTTHSPYILESMRPEEVWVFERRPAATSPGPAASEAGSAAAAACSAAADPYTHTRCLARDPVVRAMHEQGVGLGALWYGGHLDRSWDDARRSGESD